MSSLLRCCIVVVVLAGLLGAMCVPLAAAGAKPQEDIAVATTSPGSVIGRVYDAATGIPLEGAQVTVAQGGLFARQGKSVGATGEQGRYECIALLGRKSASFSVGGMLLQGLTYGAMGTSETETTRVDVTQLNLRVTKSGYRPFEGVVKCRTTGAEHPTTAKEISPFAVLIGPGPRSAKPTLSVVLEPILLTADTSPEVSTAADGWGALRLLEVSVTPSVLHPREKAKVVARLQAPSAAALKQKQSFFDSLSGKKGKEQLRVAMYSSVSSRHRGLSLTSQETGTLVFTGEFEAPRATPSPSVWITVLVEESPVEVVTGMDTKRALVQILPAGADEKAARLRLESAGLAEAGETTQAQAKAQELCALPGAMLDDYLWLGSLSEKMHDRTTRASAMQQALKLVPTTGKTVVVGGEELKLEAGRWKVLGGYAAALVENGQASDVIAQVAPEMEKVKEKDRPKKIPGDVAVGLAAAYLESGKLTEAEVLNDKLGEWPGGSSSAQAQEFRRKLRLAQVEKATRESSESAQAWADYGRALIDQGQWEDAVVKLQTALDKNPNSPAVRRDLSYALTHLQQPQAAADADLDAALVAAEKQVGTAKGGTPSKNFYDWHTYAMLLYQKAYLQRQAGDPAAAATLKRSREMMVEAIKCGRAGADVQEESGTRRIAISGFAYPEAANDFLILDSLDILAEHPDDYLSWYTVATALLDMNQTEVAAAALQECLKLRPMFLEGKYAGARLALQQGDRESAKTLLREVLQENPKHPQANRLLAQLYAEEGDIVSSAACLAAHAQYYGGVQ